MQSVPREKTPSSIMGVGDDLFALMGMKKFNILDVSDDTAKDATATDVNVGLEIVAADNAHVHVVISVTAR